MRISDWSSDVFSSDLFRAEEFVEEVGCAIDDLRHLIESRRDIDHLSHRGALAAYPRRASARGSLGLRATVDPRTRETGGLTGTFSGESYCGAEEIGRASCRERVCQYV